MIKELVQFVNDIPSQIKARALQPKKGLHILVSFTETGEGIIKGEEFFSGKDPALSDFMEKCAKLQDLAWMVDTNKCFDLPAKGIHSASPYCFACKRDVWVGGNKYKEDKEKGKPSVVDRTEAYFEKCKAANEELSDTEKERAKQLQIFIKNDLNAVLEDSDSFKSVSGGDYIIVYLDVPEEAYQRFNQKYLQDKLFNTAEYNTEDQELVWGTSNFFNGFNLKKPYLMHQTAPFDITGRISADEAISLSEFSKYASQKLFPNPMPLFIDQNELTIDTIEIYQREDKRVSHQQIIQELSKKKNQQALGNYYLLYYSMGIIRDFDFVSKFNYELPGTTDSWKVENLFELRQNKLMQPDIKVGNVFEFEKIIIPVLFNNLLVKFDSKNESFAYRYFDEVEPKYYRPATYSLFLKYRKSAYDFIYKSMHQSIGRAQFKDICLTSILDDVKQGKEYPVKQKLNIFFSLNQYFDPKHENFNGYNMPSKLQEFKERIFQVMENEDDHLTNDEEYAFSAGQVIYYLLSKSEAGDKTHALLEPFLQKTNYQQFNNAVVNTIARYKHQLSFEGRRFNKLASEVLGYETTTPLTNLTSFILAGYFSPSLFFKKSK